MTVPRNAQSAALLKSSQVLAETPAIDAHEKRTLSDAYKPRPVQRGIVSVIVNCLVDLLLLAGCLGFLSFAILVKTHDGAPLRQKPDFYAGLLAASRYGPTIFPILFAAVVGRTIKSTIQWRLQRGEHIRVLDLLASSTTVGGAVTSQISLRRASILGMALIVLWSLSPIGGQASLRLVSVGNETATMGVRYVVPSVSMFPWSGSNAPARKPLLDAMFSTLLLGSAASRAAPTDIWNNVKIPMMEILEEDTSMAADGWYSVEGNQTEYASLVGVPISPLRDTPATQFLTLSTWYWTLDCRNLSSDNVWILIQSSQSLNTTSAQTWHSGVCSASGAGTGCLLSDTGRNNYSMNDAGRSPRQLFFSAENYNARSLFVSQSAAVCSMYTSYIDVQVACIGRQCAVHKARRSLTPQSDEKWTVFDCASCWVYGIPQFDQFSDMFTSSLVPGYGTSRQTLVSGYLADPSTPFSQQDYPPASQLPPKTYSIRVSQLLNTFWTALSGTSVLASGLGTREGNETGSYWDVAFNITSTDGSVITPSSVLQCHKGWWATSLWTSSLLVVVCLLAPLLRLLVGNPEVALNFSSLVRDNAYVAASSLGSSLDAPARARSMGEIRLRFGDVRPDGDVGHVALGSVDDATAVWRVRKGRKFE
ncbi:hypothetical protein LTR10_012194 [Elasticomyces elasticus]|nr:hypothetical protein LTR10_012194 [Elasticomyces elasticus]KAK4965674.1 hypothetical protein LTR42_011687 [Elasticomyces elasticus]